MCSTESTHRLRQCSLLAGICALVQDIMINSATQLLKVVLCLRSQIWQTDEKHHRPPYLTVSQLLFRWHTTDCSFSPVGLKYWSPSALQTVEVLRKRRVCQCMSATCSVSRGSVRTMFDKIIALDEEHKKGIKFFMSVYQTYQVSRMPLGEDLTKAELSALWRGSSRARHSRKERT